MIYLEYDSVAKMIKTVHGQQLFRHYYDYVDAPVLFDDFNNDGYRDLICNNQYYDVSVFTDSSFPSDTSNRWLKLELYHNDLQINRDTVDLGEIVLLNDTTISFTISNVGNKMVHLSDSELTIWVNDSLKRHEYQQIESITYGFSKHIVPSNKETTLNFNLKRRTDPYDIFIQAKIKLYDRWEPFWFKSKVKPSDRKIEFNYHETLAPAHGWQISGDTANWSISFNNHSNGSFYITDIYTSVDPEAKEDHVIYWTDYNYPKKIDTGSFVLDSITITLTHDWYWQWRNLPGFYLYVEYDHFGTKKTYTKKIAIEQVLEDGFKLEIRERRVRNGDTVRIRAFDTLDFRIEPRYNSFVTLHSIDFSSHFYARLLTDTLPHEFKTPHSGKLFDGEFAYQSNCSEALDSLVIVMADTAFNRDGTVNYVRLYTRFVAYIDPIPNDQVDVIHLESIYPADPYLLPLNAALTRQLDFINAGNTTITDLYYTADFDSEDYVFDLEIPNSELPLQSCDAIQLSLHLTALRETETVPEVYLHYLSDHLQDSIRLDFGRYFGPLATYENASLIIYPNPVNDILGIVTEEAPEHVSVYDMAGHIVLSGRMMSSREEAIEVDVSALKPGVYLLRVDESYLRFVKN